MYEMLDSWLNPHLFIGIVFFFLLANASVVDSKESETWRLGRLGLGIWVFKSGSGRVLSGPSPSSPSNLDPYRYL